MIVYQQAMLCAAWPLPPCCPPALAVWLQLRDHAPDGQLPWLDGGYKDAEHFHGHGFGSYNLWVARDELIPQVSVCGEWRGWGGGCITAAFPAHSMTRSTTVWLHLACPRTAHCWLGALNVPICVLIMCFNCWLHIICLFVHIICRWLYQQSAAQVAGCQLPTQWSYTSAASTCCAAAAAVPVVAAHSTTSPQMCPRALPA